METPWPDNYARDITADNDRKNLRAIQDAIDNGRINNDTAEYMTRLYSCGMDWFREVFYFLGKCFGAPKAPVMRYDYGTDSAIDSPISIADINPLSPYIVHHRLDADPMRNQFFTTSAGHRIDLAVSSIVTVIVGAQKRVDRALDKITIKYYTKYMNEVADAITTVITTHHGEDSAQRVVNELRKRMQEKYITEPAETVLAIIGSGHEQIAVELVRALDKIKKPHLRLQDVWRVKCLFDLIPQARTFIERVREMMPERVLSVRDNFYDMVNPRNYRDAKVIINIGTSNEIVPMEIICQVRSFFEFEHRTHKEYELVRTPGATATTVKNVDMAVANLHDDGMQEYNLMIVRCLDSLFDRVGWNILYNQGNGVSMFEGFPHKCRMYYPNKLQERITTKLEDAVRNEIFNITDAPAKLSPVQQTNIFHFMVEFVLVTAMPYANRDWTVPSDTLAGRLFNFVMSEIQRYYKKH